MTDSDLTLYTAVPSRGMIAHWALEELGVPHRRELLDIHGSDAAQRPEYLAINPLGQVPTLVHGAVTVTETAAVVSYLAETFADGRLAVPPGSPQRGAYLRWMHYAQGGAEPSIIWAAQANQDPEARRPYATPQRVAETIAAAVTGKDYLLEDRFTAADIMIGATVMWGLNMMPVLPRLPELERYWAGLEQRPGWQAVIATLPPPP